MSAAAAPPSSSTERAAQRLEAIRRLYPFQSHAFDHGGVKQHFVDEGDRDATPVLCLHGNPTWSFFWRAAIRALRPRHRVVAVDHVGCGMSDKPQDYPYLLEQHIANVERIVHALELDRITLLLHDWGGAIGMGLARRMPERIARLAILNSAAFRSRRMPARIRLCRTPWVGRLAVQGLNAFAKAATYMAVETPLPKDVRRGYLLPYDSFHNRIATHAFVEDIPLDESHPSYAELTAIEESLPTFRDRPSALFWGEKDWCFTPHFREEWQVHLPNAQVFRYPEAGHYVIEDAAPELLSDLTGFLETTA